MEQLLDYQAQVSGMSRLFEVSVVSSDLADGQNVTLRAILPSDSGILVLWPAIPNASAAAFIHGDLITHFEGGTRGPLWGIQMTNEKGRRSFRSDGRHLRLRHSPTVGDMHHFQVGQLVAL